jgi:capsular polysaccharide biosynthesis protein
LTLTDRPSLDALGLKHGTDKSSRGHGFLASYEYFFREFRDDAFNLLEIGGLNGASLRMWEEYFPNARIICIDTNPKVAAHASGRITVEIGSAGDKDYLAAFRKTHRRARIVIDDGSHRWDHQRIALRGLFGMVEPGGFYVVEDIHTSFEPGYAGDDSEPFFNFLNRLAEYLHLRGDRRLEFEARNNPRLVRIAQQIDMIAFVERSCIIRKKLGPPPPPPATRATLARKTPVAGSQPDNPVFDDMAAYHQAGSFAQLAGPGDRFFSGPTRSPPAHAEPKNLLTGETVHLRAAEPLRLVAAKVAEALILSRGLVVNVRTRAIVPASVRFRDGEIPPVVRDKLGTEAEATRIDRWLSSPRLRRIEGPAFYLCSRNHGYGHFLLEGMSRAWPALQDCIRGRVLVNKVGGGWTETLAGVIFPDNEIVALGAAPVLVTDLIVPSPAYEISSKTSPDFAAITERIARHFREPSRIPGRLYLSRRLARKRKLTNEDEVEAIFREYGFEIMTPETVPLAEQIKRFAAAEWIAGPVGSALYNVVFCPPDVRKIVLAPSSFYTANDLTLSRGHAPDYILAPVELADPRRATVADWSIDAEDVRRGLKAALDN